MFYSRKATIKHSMHKEQSKKNKVGIAFGDEF
jgi:hypothetical protein